ncbi:MAG: aldehyde dehydrogenase family protein [Pseudomonadota bacterium]
MTTQTAQSLPASDALTLPALENHIDGTVEAPRVDRHNPLLNPATLEPLQAQFSSSPEQVERALAASQAAYEAAEWEGLSALERADILERIAAELESPAAQDGMATADALTTGAVIRVTRLMAALTPYVFRHAADHLRSGALQRQMPGKAGDVEVSRAPWGPALLVSPWNGPTAIGSHKIASALAAGAPCIAKPSEWAPHSAIIMAQAIARTGLPKGVFQLVCGNREIGARMVEDSRIAAVSFTGGTAGGRAIASACSHDLKPMQLELGGNNPLVVFEDADLDRAAEGIVYGLTNLNAQWCRALGRLVVQHSIKEALLERVAQRMAELVIGDPMDDASDMGPMIHRGQYDTIQRDIDRLLAAGGRAIVTATLPTLPGYFIAPTLIEGCNPLDTVEEIFGPVAAVHSFDTEAEALALANGTSYGLAAYVYSGNEARAWAFGRKIRTGGVKINGYSLLSLSPTAPRGAWGLSGLGEEGTSQSIEFFTGARVVGASPQDRIGAL